MAELMTHSRLCYLVNALCHNDDNNIVANDILRAYAAALDEVARLRAALADAEKQRNDYAAACEGYCADLAAIIGTMNRYDYPHHPEHPNDDEIISRLREMKFTLAAAEAALAEERERAGLAEGIVRELSLSGALELELAHEEFTWWCAGCETKSSGRPEEHLHAQGCPCEAARAAIAAAEEGEDY